MLRALGWLGFLLLVSIGPAALADTATWNGTSGNWSEATRWSTDPDSPNNDLTTYDVEFGAGTLTQDVAGGVTVDSLTWSGGTLTGSESLTVLNTVNWTNGSLANSGGLVVPVGSLLTYSGSSTQHKLDSAGKLVIGGTFRLVGVGDLNTSAAIASGATVDVLDGATFDIQGDGNLSDTFFDNFGQLRKGTVSNAGLFTKSSGSGTSLVTDDWTFDNLVGGELTVSSGTLQFSRNGNGFNNAGLAQVTAGTLRVGGGTSTGTFDVAVGGTLQFVTSSSISVVHVLDGATINNNGTLEVDGQLRFNNGATITGDRTLSLIGDDAEIGGSEPITLDGFNWTAGRLANSGGLTVAAGGTMAISGSGAKKLANNASLSISGTATLAGTQSIVNLASVAAPARVEIGLGGILDLQADVGLSESPSSEGSNGGALLIDGTFRKTGGSGSSDVSIDWEVENNGDVEVESGTIRFFGDVAHHGTVDLTGGNVEFRGNVMGEGNFTGTGLATFRRDYRPGASPAAISFGGDLRFDSSAANLFVEIGGTDTGQYDQLLVAGTAELAGSLRVQWIDLGAGLFSPSAGDAFEIVSAAGGITGAFTPILPALADGLAWKVMKSSNSLSLLVESTGSDTLLGDYNLNGIVDAADYTVWRNSVGQAGAGLAADGNHDEIIDGLDYGVWKSHYGEFTPTGGGGGAAVAVAAPEPCAICLAVIGAMLLSWRSHSTQSSKLSRSRSRHSFFIES